MAAGCNLLDGQGYRELKVEAVCDAADVAKGTFYVYFAGKEAFLHEIARQYLEFEPDNYLTVGPNDPLFDSARRWIAAYEDMFAANVGVLRCMVQMGGEDPTMREMWRRRNATVVDHALRQMGVEPGAPDAEARRWAFRAVGGMLDQSLFERYGVQPGPGLEEPEDPEHRLDLHAVLAYRALTGVNPPVDALSQDSPVRALLRS